MNVLDAVIEPDIVYQFSDVVCSYTMEYTLPERAVTRTLYVDGNIAVQNDGLSSEPLYYTLDGSNELVGKELTFRIQSDVDGIDYTVTKMIENGRAILTEIKIEPEPVYQYSEVICSYMLSNVIFEEKTALRTLYLDGVIIAQNEGLSDEPLTYILDGSNTQIGQELVFSVIIEEDGINAETRATIQDGSAFLESISVGDETQYTNGQVNGTYLLTDTLAVAYVPDIKIKALGVSESEYTGFIDDVTEIAAVPLTGLTSLIIHHGYDSQFLEDVILGLEFVYEDETTLEYGQTSSAVGQQEIVETQRLVAMDVWAVSIVVQRVAFSYVPEAV